MTIAIIPMRDNRKTGYKFLDRTKTGALHAGEDLNFGTSGYSDLGEPVKSMSAGIVEYARYSGGGWGNLVVIYHPQLSKMLGHDVWTRYAHFKQIYVGIGQVVNVGDVIGLCGKSGTGSPHCHWEVIIKKLKAWTSYTNGWSLAKVKQYFASPYDFLKAVNKQYEEVPDYAIESVKKAADKLISMKVSDINKIIGDATAEQIFINLGVLNKAEGNLSKARFLVALDRMGLLG
jgi:murein DD-endopeptidase MepM/ murein hydrolase activator NlpD